MHLSITDVASALGVTEGEVRRWIRSGGLPAARWNEQFRINSLDLISWAQDRQIRLPEAITVPAGRTSADRREPLAPAVAAGGIHRDLEGDTPAAVVQAALTRLRLPQSVDRALLASMLAARAGKGTTAMGDGIAMPHARFPIVATVPATLGLFVLRRPVAWDAPDGRAVDIVALVVSPTPHVHLGLLAAAARTFSAGLADRLRRGDGDRALMAWIQEVDRGGPAGP